MASLRVNGIEPESIVDGRGFRFVVFVQGCPHGCPGCHNPQTHAFDGGRVVDTEDLLCEIAGNPLLRGITLSGGEPFCQPVPLAELASRVHAMGLDVTVYTGYTYEALAAMQNAGVNALLAETDTLVDGPFLLEQRDLTLRFRGSANQRVIDMGRTRAQGRVVLDLLEDEA